jgi:hypothetical protein
MTTMSMYRCYTWTYQLEAPPFGPLMDVLNAFFAAYPKGDYTCELRETYKLEFRRGRWKRLLGFGPQVPAALVRGDFTQWPLIVRVLARPSPERNLISARYELHLPRSIKELVPELQNSVDLHIRAELADLGAYLAECMNLEKPPEITAA